MPEEDCFQLLDCVISEVERPLAATLFPQVPAPKLLILLSDSRLQSGRNEQPAGFQRLLKTHTHTPPQARVEIHPGGVLMETDAVLWSRASRGLFGLAIRPA